jgi:hypothetical protein
VIDELLEVIDSDSGFRTFFLDGQMILLRTTWRSVRSTPPILLPRHRE